MVSKGYTYLCMTEKDFGNRIPFKFLEELEKKFLEKYGEKAKTALENSLNSEFKKTLRQLQEFHSNQKNDNISKVKNQIDEVKGIMINNIDKVLERGDQLDQLVVRTEELTNVSQDFRVKAKKLKNTMWWKNVKLLLILVFIIFVSRFYFNIFSSLFVQLFGLFVDFQFSKIVEDGLHHNKITTIKLLVLFFLYIWKSSFFHFLN